MQLRKQRNMSILLTTHYMEEAAISDEIIMLDKGAIVAQGSPQKLKGKYQATTLDEVFLKVARQGGQL